MCPKITMQTKSSGYCSHVMLTFCAMKYEYNVGNTKGPAWYIHDFQHLLSSLSVLCEIPAKLLTH